MRNSWGVQGDTKIILVVGRMLRRKGHHVVVEAVRRLKEMGLKDFMCVFVGEDQGKSRYSGELWDLVHASGTTDVIRMAGPTDDLPAAFAASTAVVNAAIQPEGLQRANSQMQTSVTPWQPFPQEFRTAFPGGWQELAQREGFELPKEFKKK